MTIETHDELERVAPEWNALADRVDAPPSMYPGWIAAWQRWFGGGRLAVVCARRGGELAGVLAIASRRGVLTSPTNWHTPFYAPLADDPETTEELVAAALATRPRRLDLSFVRGDDPQLAPSLRAARSLRYRTFTRMIERSPYIPIEGNWASYEGRMPSRRRSRVSRFRRRLDERGEVAVDLEGGERHLEALLEEGFAVEALGWKGERGTAIASSPRTRGFYGAIARWAAERGWLRLWFLRLDGRTIAFAYCLERGGRHYELKTGFDPEYRSFGPGVLLTRARLEHSFGAGLRSYEFLGQAERHKLDWTDACRELWRVQAFAPNLAGGASRLAWTRGRRLAQRAQGLVRHSR